ncbi:MAG: TIGR01777 family oxidoreductase [Phycisphaeraceae bacterium]
MSDQIFVHRTHLNFPAEQVFAWHARPGAFERLMPPWEQVQLVERTGAIRDGDRTHVRIRVAGIWLDWIAEHRDYVEGRQFRDVQVQGPMRRWEHLHTFEPAGPDACTLEDRITCELPGGKLGEIIGGRFNRHKLERMFAYRERLLTQDLAVHARYAADRPWTIAITGASGLIGSALTPLLTTAGYTVKHLVRREPREAHEIRWSPDAGDIDAAALAGVDAVVNLAGEPVMGWWNEAKKQRILDSRVNGTRLIAQTLATLDPPPRVLVNASGINYYGSSGGEPVDESSPPGEGFLTETCQAWEAATQPASEAGVRTVMFRLGMVLSPKGGALATMLPIFRAGFAGPLGDGRHWWSWITLDDAIYAITHALFSNAVQGPVNLTSPEPVTNRDFTRTLGKVLGRPTVLPAPRFALRLGFGEMADETMFASARVMPRGLQETGYTFAYPALEPALRHLLGR